MKREIRRIALAAGVVLIALALVFTGCQKTEKTLMSEFKSMTKSGPTAEGLTAAVSFLDRHIDYALRYAQGEGPADQEAPLESWYLARGEDGEVHIDYRAMLERFGAFISVELNELFTLKAEEFEDPSTGDAQIIRSYEDIIDRALKAEKLLQEHKNDDVLRANTLEYYRDYLFLLLAGSDRTPVFDYETGLFSHEARTVYEDFIAASPDTVLADALIEYFAYLNNVDFSIDYSDPVENKVFYNTCDYIIERALKKL
jgi:hypothetical protein